MLRIVVDNNIWVRTLWGGPASLPVLIALRERRFRAIVSQALVEELQDVVSRPRLKRRITSQDIDDLLELLEQNGELVELSTVPPCCRDPKDEPVLATAIDGRADAIVSGDSDLRGDDELRAAMLGYGVQLWGVEAFLGALEQTRGLLP